MLACPNALEFIGQQSYNNVRVFMSDLEAHAWLRSFP